MRVLINRNSQIAANLISKKGTTAYQRKPINMNEMKLKQVNKNFTSKDVPDYKALFNTLWATVITKLNNSSALAPCARLAEEIRSSKIPFIYPYKPLPNVETFSIKFLHPHDPVLLKHGIQRRTQEAEKETTPYRNKAMNRYVKTMFILLNKNRSNPIVFWNIARKLMRYSNSYRCMCLNHVYPQWHKTYKYYVIQNILKSLMKLDLRDYYYKIVHIPKANGTKRPLGVPSPAWRIYLHGLNNILMV